jgi:hypothetical protein
MEVNLEVVVQMASYDPFDTRMPNKVDGGGKFTHCHFYILKKQI